MPVFRNLIFRFTHSVILLGFFTAVMAQAPDWTWARAVITDDYEHVNDLVVDRSTNDVYIVGQWERDLSGTFSSGANPATDFSSPFGQMDGFVAKYDSGGSFIWAFKVGGSNDDIVKSIAIDGDGNIYITGYFGTGMSNYFSGTSSHTLPSMLDNLLREDFFLAKYNSDGEFLWVRRSSSDWGNLAGLDVFATSSAVFATGRANDLASFGPLNMSNVPNGDDIFLIKYNLDGDEQWVAECGSNGDDMAHGVIADETNVYFTGSFEGGTLNLRNAAGGTANSLSNANNGTLDIVLGCYDIDGNHTWSHAISSNQGDRGLDITMDADSIYITGALNHNASFPGYSGNPVPSSAGRDIFFSSHAKSDGSTGWVVTLPCTDSGNERGWAIDTDGTGNLYITGDFEDNLTLPDASTLSASGPGGQEDFFVCSFTTGGNYRWALSAGSNASEDAHGISVGSHGAIYIGGRYRDEMTLGSSNLPDGSLDNGFLAKLSNGIQKENDDPCSAILLAVGDSCNEATYDNYGAHDSGIPDPGCADYAGEDVWFKAVIPPSGNLLIGTNTSTDDTYPPTNGWMYRIGLAVYTGSCASLNLEGCYAYNSAYHYRASSAYLYDKNPGDTVWIRIYERFGNDYGKFSICTYDPGHYPGWNIAGSYCLDNGPIVLDSTVTGVKSGFADEVVDFWSVFNPEWAEGEPGTEWASLSIDEGWIILDLTDTIPAGETYELHFRSNPIMSGVAQITLQASLDNVTYHQHSFKPETESDDFITSYITAEHPTRYLLCENDNAGGGGFSLDGIKYYFRGTRGGTWSGPGVTGSMFDPTGLSGPVPVTYTVGEGNTLSDSTRMINISKSEAGILTPDTAVCFDNEEFTVQLNDFRGNILSWEISTDSISIYLPITNPFLTVSNLTETSRYRVIVQDGSCQPDTSNRITIVVHPASSANLSGDTIICNGSAASLKVDFTGDSPWDFSFENDADTINVNDITANPYEFNVSPSLITDYSLVGLVDGNGCNGLLSGSARVVPIPIANPGKDSSLCGLTFKFDTVTGIGPGIWSQLSGPGNAVFSPGAIHRDAEVSVDAYGAYEFTWTQTEGTCVDDSTTTIEFFQSPMANAGSGSSVCGLTAGLQAIPSVGSGTWSVLSGPGTAVFAPGESDPNVLVTVGTEGIYEFVWTETNGPCQDTAAIKVDFFQPPQLTAINGEEVCGLSFQLEAFNDAGTGTWSKSTGPGQAIFVSGTASAVTGVTVDAYGTYTFSWTVHNGICADSIMVNVTFVDEITVDAGADSDVCGLEYALGASPAILPGHWEKIAGPGNVTFLPADTVSNATVRVDDYGSYEFQWMEATDDCSGRDNVVVRFNEQPVADAGQDQELDHVFSTYLEATAPAYGTGTWEIVKGTGQIQDRNDPGSQVTGLSMGENEFNWTVSNVGCADVSDNVLITVKDIQTPTVITPNNDGYNDQLVFSGIREVMDSEIVIYSRWGNELYRNEDYRNDWDGRDHNGRELPVDTYYYILKLNSGRLIKGFVEIRR